MKTKSNEDGKKSPASLLEQNLEEPVDRVLYLIGCLRFPLWKETALPVQAAS